MSVRHRSNSAQHRSYVIDSGRGSSNSARFVEIGPIWADSGRTLADVGRVRPKFGRNPLRAGFGRNQTDFGQSRHRFDHTDLGGGVRWVEGGPSRLASPSSPHRPGAGAAAARRLSPAASGCRGSRAGARSSRCPGARAAAAPQRPPGARCSAYPARRPHPTQARVCARSRMWPSPEATSGYRGPQREAGCALLRASSRLFCVPGCRAPARKGASVLPVACPGAARLGPEAPLMTAFGFLEEGPNARALGAIQPNAPKEPVLPNTIS